MRDLLHTLTAPLLDVEGAGGEGAVVVESEAGSTPLADGTEAPSTEAPAGDAGTVETPPLPVTTLPLDRHESILRNARRDGDEVVRTLGWARDMDRDRVTRALSLLDHQERDPMGFANHVASSLSGGQEPPPDLQDDQGRQFYSAQQAAKLADYRASTHVTALERKFEARLGPLETRGLRSDADTNAADQLEEARGWTDFEENMTPIAQAMADAQQRGQPLTLAQAYFQVVQPKQREAQEKLEAKIRKKILAEMNGQTPDTNDTDPTRSAPGQTTVDDKDKSLTQMLSEEHARVERASAGAP